MRRTTFCVLLVVVGGSCTWLGSCRQPELVVIPPAAAQAWPAEQQQQVQPPSWSPANNNRDLQVLINELSVDNVDPQGGTVTVRQGNGLGVAISVTVRPEAPGWSVSPSTTSDIINPEQASKWSFHLKPLTSNAPQPRVIISYTLLEPDGKQTTLEHTVVLHPYAVMEIPKFLGLTVDGDLTDWAGVAPMKISQGVYVFEGQDNWTGPADLSYDVLLAQDGQWLYAAIDVKDDQLATDAANPADNDAVEFFWDARPAGSMTDSPGAGCGHVVIPVPAQGSQARPAFILGSAASLQAAVVRTSGGYVCELRLPLAEIGIAGPPQPGLTIHLEVQVDDRDADGLPTITRMVTSGQPASNAHTMGYMRCTFK